MGDCSACEVYLFGVAGKEDQLVEIFGDWSQSWMGRSAPDAAFFQDGCRVVDDEISIGTLWEIGPELESLGVSYWGLQDAKYEFSALERLFTPELGIFESDQNGEGSTLVHASDIDKAIEESGDLYRYVGEQRVAWLIERLDALSGRAHRQAFEALMKAHPDPNP